MTQPTEEETNRATREMFRSLIRQLAILLAILLAGGAAVGWLVSGERGVWGALIGAGLAALFLLTTVGVMLATTGKPVHYASGGLVFGWIAKMVVLFVVLFVLKGRDFYDPVVLFGVIVVAVLGSTGLEMNAAMRARIPYVEPKQPNAR